MSDLKMRDNRTPAVLRKLAKTKAYARVRVMPVAFTLLARDHPVLGNGLSRRWRPCRGRSWPAPFLFASVEDGR